MTEPKPPRLAVKRVVITSTVEPETKRLLKKAAKATGLRIGQYIDRAVKTQCELDHVK